MDIRCVSVRPRLHSSTQSVKVALRPLHLLPLIEPAWLAMRWPRIDFLNNGANLLNGIVQFTILWCIPYAIRFISTSKEIDLE